MESIAFQVRFEASVKDRVLADAEARALVRHVDRIAAD
jgi:hypothetical protein